jgi:hypothetical protein
VQLEGSGKLKDFNGLIETQTRDLLACSTVLQPQGILNSVIFYCTVSEPKWFPFHSINFTTTEKLLSDISTILPTVTKQKYLKQLGKSMKFDFNFISSIV